MKRVLRRIWKCLNEYMIMFEYLPYEEGIKTVGATGRSPFLLAQSQRIR